jgi:hypothetical protein
MAPVETATRRRSFAKRLSPRLRHALLRATRHRALLLLVTSTLLLAFLRLVLRHAAPVSLLAPDHALVMSQVAAGSPLPQPHVNDVMPSPTPWPPDSQPPDPGLYGTSNERCVALGDRGGGDVGRGAHEVKQLWQPNSRALCYVGAPVCMYGSRLEKLLTFAPRGSGTCEVMSVQTGMSRKMRVDEIAGETCARFRQRRVASMFGEEQFYSSGFAKFHDTNRAAAPPSMPFRHAIEWHDGVRSSAAGDLDAEDSISSLAIVIPKYEWSWNICHYNRIWQYVLYVIRHLRLFVPDSASIKSIDIVFRARYPYNNVWATGIREATLPALELLTGLKISISKARYSSSRDFLCWHRAILLGQEGRVDAYPFLNDSDVWSKMSQVRDDHVPTIPHDSLWLRSVTYGSFGLPPVGNTTWTANEIPFGEEVSFTSIPVPPLVIAHVLRSARSKRRFSRSSRSWFGKTLRSLAREHGFTVRDVRFDKSMKLSRQATIMRDVGLAVGLHGANFVNTIFMPPGGALFEIFPWRYVRYYYAGGANSGLRYSFHEAARGVDQHCSSSPRCFMKYRESTVDLSDGDRLVVALRLKRAMKYVRDLHDMYPSGHIPLVRNGSLYTFAHGLAR